jgi:hypothetical protein
MTIDSDGGGYTMAVEVATIAAATIPDTADFILRLNDVDFWLR